ncbi:MAG: DUF4290 domain-containing protein [Chitinophagales bacterium]|jgi:hypothetical protein
MEYNTLREDINLHEYGRHVQQIIQICVKIEDREKRNQMAREIIELMGQLNPALRNVEDFRHKLWDQLFIISDFKLDVDSPYPKTTRALVEKKPEPLPYPQGKIRHRHYGKNVESLVKKALEEKDPEKRQAFAQTIGNYMKLVYQNWTKENTNDEIIKNDLRILSHDGLKLGLEDNISALTSNGNNSRIRNDVSARPGRDNRGGQNGQRNNNGGSGNNKNRNKYYGKNRNNNPK